jgi:16S rRNA G1207 methylase RsmC
VNSAVVCGDFLQCTTDALWGTFDRIVMNPPFERGVDIAHIKHAMTFLKPGGRLVAICANGPRQRFHLKDSGLASEWIDLPAGTFKEQGTGVNTAMLVIDKPE